MVECAAEIMIPDTNPNGEWLWNGQEWVPASSISESGPPTPIPTQIQQPIQPQQLVIAQHPQPTQMSPTVMTASQPVQQQMRTRTCHNDECSAQNPVSTNLCGSCGEVMGRPLAERLLWYFLVFFFSLNLLIITFGLRPPYVMLLLASLIMTLFSIICLTILYAESPIWIGRGILHLFGMQTSQTESSWYRHPALKWGIRILSVFLCFLIIKQFTIILLTLIFKFPASYANAYDDIILLFLLPTFGFIIGLAEFIFLYQLPSESRLFSYFSKTPSRMRLWEGGVIFIVGVMIMSWNFSGLFRPGFSHSFFLLVMQPLLLLLAIRDIPEKLRSKTTKERTGVTIPLYLIALLSFPAMYILALYSSGLDSLEVRYIIQTSNLGIWIAFEDIGSLNQLLTTMITIAEIAGVAWAMWLIHRYRKDDNKFRLKINSTQIIAIALTGLLIIPLTWASLAVSVSRQQLSPYVEEDFVAVSITLLTIDDELVVEVIVPTDYPLTGEIEGSDANPETSIELVGQIGHENNTYRGLPVAQYFYETAPCPMKAGQNLSIYLLTPNGFNSTFPVYYLPYFTTDGKAMPRAMFVLIEGDEVVTWNSEYERPGDTCPQLQ